MELLLVSPSPCLLVLSRHGAKACIGMYGPVLWALIWIAVAIGGAILAGLLFILFGVACSSLPGLGWGSVTLDCPHCGRPTPSHLAECKHCGRSFREEIAEDRPRPIPPKLQR